MENTNALREAGEKVFAFRNTQISFNQERAEFWGAKCLEIVNSSYGMLAGTLAANAAHHARLVVKYEGGAK